MADASGTVWVADIVSGSGVLHFPASWTDLASQPANVITTSVAPNQLDTLVSRRLETTNVLYTDGHVKAQKLDSLAKRRAPDGVTLSAFTIQDDV